MPIIDLAFQRGVFASRFVGRIEEEHAQFWLDTMAHFCQRDALPTGLVVDARKVSDISARAQACFAQLGSYPAIALLSISLRTAAHHPRRLMQMGLPVLPHHPVQIFPSYDSALAFAESEIALRRHAAVWRKSRRVHS